MWKHLGTKNLPVRCFLGIGNKACFQIGFQPAKILQISFGRLLATSRRDRSQRQTLRNAAAKLMVPSASVSKCVCNGFLVKRVLVVLAPFLKTWGQLGVTFRRLRFWGSVLVPRTGTKKSNFAVFQILTFVRIWWYNEILKSVCV